MDTQSARPTPAVLIFATILFLAPACLLSPPSALASSKKDRAEAGKLMAAARRVSNIEAAGSPAFRARVEVQLFGASGGRRVGEYLETWAAPDRWRREFSFQGYHDLHVRNGDTVWDKSTYKFEPYLFFLADQAFGFASRLDLEKGDKVSVGRHKVDGIECECVEFHTEDPLPTEIPSLFLRREFCFDLASASRLVREEDGEYDATYLYSDYQSFGGKVFPRKVQVWRGKKLAVQADLEELTLLPQVDASLFAEPAGTGVRVSAAHCVKAKAAKPISQPIPTYPAASKARGEEGDVLLYGVIGTDGRIRGVAVIHSDTPALGAAAAAAVSRWLYRPATCFGKPIESATPVRVKFTLAP